MQLCVSRLWCGDACVCVCRSSGVCRQSGTCGTTKVACVSQKWRVCRKGFFFPFSFLPRRLWVHIRVRDLELLFAPRLRTPEGVLVHLQGHLQLLFALGALDFERVESVAGYGSGSCGGGGGGGGGGGPGQGGGAAAARDRAAHAAPHARRLRDLIQRARGVAPAGDVQDQRGEPAPGRQAGHAQAAAPQGDQAAADHRPTEDRRQPRKPRRAHRQDPG
mmetsp:Transcript_30660/g.76285  ORF Transcript_30660/g.76285 Transcript_30660/m.76285 type:complete len:219 (+) Transcript_30660:145-801(+)